MTATPRHSVSVAAAVVREDGRVLCIRRQGNGHWEPPGGILELGERILDGLAREVHEETRIKVTAETLTGIYQNEPRDILALVFRCKATGGSPQTSDESTQTAWLDREQIKSRMTEAYAIRVIDALDLNAIPAIRTHDGERLTT